MMYELGQLLAIFMVVAMAGVKVGAQTIDTWLGTIDTNFSTSQNWSYSKGSGPVAGGDMLVFGSGGNNSPNVNNDELNYRFGSITFSSNAGNYNLGGNAFVLGTNTAGTVITDSSVNSQIINNPIALTPFSQTFWVAGGSLTLGGSLSGTNSSLTLAGGGSLIMAGSNTYSGFTTISAGTLVLTNSGLIAAGGVSTIQVGVLSGASAALYQCGGSTITVATNTIGSFQIGSAPGAFGYYNISSGTNIVHGDIEPGGLGGGAGTFGQLDMSGGAINLIGNSGINFLPNRGGPGESSVVNITGGTVTQVGGGNPTAATNGLAINWSNSGSAQTNVTTIGGAAQFLLANMLVKLNCGGLPYSGTAGNPANLATLNLNGGNFQILGFTNGAVNPNVFINFNGGTLAAGIADNPAFLGNIGGVYIYGGGATINDGVRNITISQPLLAPAGNGVSAIALASGGTGYITPPQVIITGGGGQGATASATISAGSVTGIQVTSPGNGYQNAPTVILANAVCTTPALAGTVTLATNLGGGLIIAGSGSTTLTGASTYSGTTVVTNGTLFVNNTAGSGTGTNMVVVATTATLGGSGYIAGSVVVKGKTLPGINGATNTIGGSLTYLTGSSANFYLGPSAAGGGNDQITLNGASTFLNCSNVSVGINCVANLDQTTDYPLFTLTGGGTIKGACNPTPVWLGTVPVNSLFFSVLNSNNAVVLHFNATATNVASITNLPATNVTATTAMLNGRVLATGGAAPFIFFYYGDANGGTNPAAWTSVSPAGYQAGTCAMSISNLAVNHTYFFTVAASNSAGVAWATAPKSFTTLTATLATVTNLPATGIFSTFAILNGMVLTNGNDTPVVQVYYGTSDGGTNPAGWSGQVRLGRQSGNYSAQIAGLTPGTTYYFNASASNSAGVYWPVPSASFNTLPVTRVPVTTYHYDNTRQGANTNETALTPTTVNATNFGKLFSYALDGYVYAQPLIMTNVAIAGKGVHNVVYVATENDTVYAFDADSNTGTNGGWLWQTSVGTPVSNTLVGSKPDSDMSPSTIGITGTPVIDPLSGTLYLDASTYTNGVIQHWIHALNIANGSERSYSPTLVSPVSPGKAADGNGTNVGFNPQLQASRPALTLAGGIVYACYGSYQDKAPCHGWVVGFNATNLAPLTNYVYNANPNTSQGSIWMAGDGMSVDENTNLYFTTANGVFDANTNGGDFGDSLVKLASTNGLALADYFTPYNQLDLQNHDADLGGGGLMLLPDEAGNAANPHLLTCAGKGGTIYLVNRDNLGKYNTNSDSQIVQSLPSGLVNGMLSTPAYFNHAIYYAGGATYLRALGINNGLINPNPLSLSTSPYGSLGSPVVSANGTNNGILWVMDNAAYASSGPTVLYAFNATNLSLILYKSSQNLTRDSSGGAVKFTGPVVTGGKVYVAGEYALSVYGTGIFMPTPVVAPAGGAFTNNVQISLSGAPAGAFVYFTLDGSTPTANSMLYTGPFLLTSNALLQAITIAAGAVNSAVVSAAFVNTAAPGDGSGLTGQYWANTSGTTITNAAFNLSPSLTRTDSVVNFNWGASGPDPSVGGTNFVARWTGSVQPRYNQTNYFYITANGGVRLWVNGQLLINNWSIPGGTTTLSNGLFLAAQQLYNIELDYYQTTNNGTVSLSWSSPVTAPVIIPQTQLYPYTNPPPTVEMLSPSMNANYTASASVTLSAEADAPYNPISAVSFYANQSFLGAFTNEPYTLTTTGLAAGNYALTAVAVDGSGLSTTSAPVNISVRSGSGLPYGLTASASVPAFLNLPPTFNGALPPVLSLTGVYSDTPNRVPAGGVIPYAPNSPLWSDGAVKTRYFAVPNNGGAISPAEQINFASTGSWTFPAGTVFVKNFDLVVNATNPSVPVRRLETRLLVRDINGAAYGITYKWRPDNSDADLLLGNSNEDLLITNTSGVSTQTWYYPSPADCLTCHTPVANYVLGLSTRQLNGPLTYPTTGVTDNQLRTLNRLGLFNPAFDEAGIINLEALSAVTNQSAPFQDRSRSYLDSNCAQCHQPGGTGITFDARYDTPLSRQNITNYPATVSLGSGNACIIAGQSLSNSMIYQRINTTMSAIKMPPLARSLIDTNAVAVFAGWINSLPATPVITQLPAASPIIYGQPLASSSLTGGAASTDGSFVFTTPGLVPAAGVTNASVTFMPTDLVYYSTVTTNIDVTVQPVVPVITQLPSASPIINGQTLASSILSGGSASTSGSFAFTAPGIVPNPPTATVSVTFTPSDSNNYTPVLANIEISVLLPPVINFPPGSVSAVAGDNVFFSVRASGTNPLNYQWSFNGAPLAGATNSTLELDNVQLTNNGNYVVTVSNGAGATNSPAAGLIVQATAPAVPTDTPLLPWWGGGMLLMVLLGAGAWAVRRNTPARSGRTQ